VQVRACFASELVPLPLEVYEEQLPVFDGWPDAPCGYLQFGPNPAYELAAHRATCDGFIHIRLEGGHFHLLVEPEAVAVSLLDLRWRMGIWDMASINPIHRKRFLGGLLLPLLLQIYPAPRLSGPKRSQWLEPLFVK
jgi:hypothetical protein